MGSSALRYSGATVRVGRSPLLKLQSDERLVNMVRKGNQGAFEVLVARYHARLLSFCRHMLGSREDAEDVLQDVLTASYNAMLADDRPINVRPWLYRIARNRCLNHLRRNRAVGVDSMDIHLAEHGATTADKVHEREEFRQLLHDIRDLPETQRTALVLREMDALSYEQIAEAMETTVSSVKSLLVRARVSLTEAAEARLLTCEEVREELAEIAEGMRRKQSASVRRHVKNCSRCQVFQGEMKKSSRALAALAPIGPLAFFHKLLFAHAASHTAGSAGIAGAAGAGGAGGAGAAGAGAAGAGAAGAAGGAGSAGLVTAGVGAVATKAAAGIAAAALVTAGTVAIDHTSHHQRTGPPSSVIVQRSLANGLQAAVSGSNLSGSVPAGPGLSTPASAPKVVKDIGARVVPSVITVGTTVSQSSHTTKDATTATGTVRKLQKSGAPVSSQPAKALTPPVSYLQSSPTSGSTGSGGTGPVSTGSGSTGPGSTGSGLNPSGGAGLGAAGGTSTTSTTSSAPATTSTPTTSVTVPTTPTPTSTSATGSTTTVATGTSTTSTGTGTTSTGTGTTTAATPTTTSATATTTTASATGTTTLPVGTTTSTPTTTAPANTSTDAATVTNPSAPTTGTVTTPAG